MNSLVNKIKNIPPKVFLPFAAFISLIIGIISQSEAPVVSYTVLFLFWTALLTFTFLWAVSLYSFQIDRKSLFAGIREHRLELIAIITLTLAAFIIRIINIKILPMPFSGDEAVWAMQAQDVNNGLLKNPFISGFWGIPTINFFISAFFHRFFTTEVAQRLPSVITGALSIPALYLFLRSIWGKVIAFAAAVFLVGYHFHHHWSRIGMSHIADTLIAPLAFYLAWNVMTYRRKADFVMLGLVLGLSLYSFVTARLIPVLVVVFLIFVAITQKGFLRKHIADFGLLVLAYFVVAAPLAVYWGAHSSDFMTRIGSEGIFQSGWFKKEISSGKSSFEILSNQIKKSFGLFGFLTDGGPPHHHSPIPLVDKFSLTFFLIGLIWSLSRFWQPGHFILLILFTGSVIAGGVLTVDAYSGRIVSTIPVVAAWVALGLFSFQSLFSRKTFFYILMFCIVFALAGYNLWFYYSVYSSGEYYSDLNTRIAQNIGDYAQTLPSTTVLFLYGAPIFFTGHPALSIKIRDKLLHYDVPKDKTNSALQNSSPSPRTFIFIYDPIYRAEELDSLKKDCEGGAVRNFSDRHGKLLFTSYEFINSSSCLPEQFNSD